MIILNQNANLFFILQKSYDLSFVFFLLLDKISVSYDLNNLILEGTDAKKLGGINFAKSEKPQTFI